MRLAQINLDGTGVSLMGIASLLSATNIGSIRASNTRAIPLDEVSDEELEAQWASAPPVELHVLYLSSPFTPAADCFSPWNMLPPGSPGNGVTQTLFQFQLQLVPLTCQSR